MKNIKLFVCCLIVAALCGCDKQHNYYEPIHRYMPWHEEEEANDVNEMAERLVEEATQMRSSRTERSYYSDQKEYKESNEGYDRSLWAPEDEAARERYEEHRNRARSSAYDTPEEPEYEYDSFAEEDEVEELDEESKDIEDIYND